MLYLTCTTITSIDLAHYGVSRAKDWVSVKCGTRTVRRGGSMICDFTSLVIVVQLYQDNGREIMKGCVQWYPVYCCKDSHAQRDSNPGPLDQQASA